MSEVIAFLEARIAHLKVEETRQPRSQYAQAMKWRRLEAEHILSKIRAMEEKP
jgi:hypothetical protein